jgi:excisionase family DNA binding protein
MAFQPQPGTFYKIPDLVAAGLARVHTIRRWIKSGNLKASRVGRDYIITGEELQRLLTEGSGVKPNTHKKAAVNK